MPVLKRIPPSAELLWFAPEAVRALLLNGETISAEAWFALMRASALFNKESSQGLAALMPIVRLMGSSEAAEWNTKKISAWWNTIKDKKNAVAKAALLYSLFDALGESVPPESWKSLVTGTGRRSVSMPNPALWFRLLEATEAVRKGPGGEAKEVAQVVNQTGDQASDAVSGTTQPQPAKGAERVAETVLLSLLALGDAGPAGADPLLLRQVLKSLRSAGFDHEARIMAVEAALAAGL